MTRALVLLPLLIGCSPIDFPTDCDDTAQPWCASLTFLGSLSGIQQGRAYFAWEDAESKTIWSNLPAAFSDRNGVALGDISDESHAAALAAMQTVLSDEGYAELEGVLAADDYLAELAGGRDYGAGQYYVAIFGQPADGGDWMLQFSGHHITHNITFRSSSDTAPTPNHFGAEPKGDFSLGGESYSTILDDGQAMFDMIGGLEDSEKDAAYLDGTFADVLVQPDDGSGTLPSYPPREGVVVSSLSASQQALVAAALAKWLGDYTADIADPLTAAYTAEAALADTHIAWGGAPSGPDADTAGSYVRIDGPRVWIELVVQDGVIIDDETHYHSFFRDKTQDYGASL